MKKVSLKQYAALVVGFSCCLSFKTATASDWLMLQGTEPAGAESRADVLGLLQPSVQYTKGTAVPDGAWSGAAMRSNMTAPDYTSRATFRIDRAQLGVRGANFPIDSKVNYLVRAEMGNDNAANTAYDVRLLDASVTLNHIPGARIRLGQFKYPGAEEALQSVASFDYVNFTNITDQILLERFFDTDGSGTTASTDSSLRRNSGSANNPNGPSNAFRDIGAQVFDTFKMGAIEYSYAGMIGNGNGLMRTDNNGAKDYYGYLSTEFVLGGDGARRDGLKGFGWFQRGKRNLVTESSGTVGEYNRTRLGAGLTMRVSRARAAFEYVWASGMIYNGTDGDAVAGSTSSAATGNVISSNNVLAVEKANGWYVDFGYQVVPLVELDLRYDSLHRATENSVNQRDFSTLTLGAQLFLNRRTRAILNYEMRTQEAPNADASTKTITEAMNGRFALQVSMAF